MLVGAENVAQVEADLGAVRLGPSMWGTVYRARDDGRRCYRLISNELNIRISQRADLQAWTTRPGEPHIASVEGVGPREFAGRWYHVVTYICPQGDTLAEVLEGADAAARVRAVAAALRALPKWWRAVGEGFLPMPCDIVVGDKGVALLRVPHWGVPAISELFAEPARITYLSPEILRGGKADSNADLFCLGAMAIRCFASVPADHADQLMHRAACGAAFASEHCESRLPVWLTKVAAVQRALEATRAFTSVRPRAHGTGRPTELAATLEQCPPVMEPIAAIRALRDTKRFRESMDLARAVMLDHTDYDLLLLVADIAWKDLRDPLEALSLLARAIVCDSTKKTAYAKQIALITDLRSDIFARLALAIDTSFARRLDETMDNAFGHLDPVKQDARAHDMASYLLERGRMAEANVFLDKMLHEGDTELWWRFDLMLLYGETFLRLDRLEEATQVVALMKWGLVKVRQNRTMTEADVRGYGKQVAEFELRLYRHRQGREQR